jgi:hypothetical protein
MLKTLVLATTIGICSVGTAWASDGWEGTWRDTELLGIGPNAAENCEVVTLGDRTLILGKSGDGYEGQWLTAFERRATRASRPNERCQLTGATKNPLFTLRMHRWSISGRLDPATGRMKVVGHSGDCTGDGCEPDWKEKNGTFQTILQLRNGRMVDLGPDASDATQRTFIPDSEYRVGAAAVAPEMKRVAALVSNGQCADFYDAASSAFRNGMARAQFVMQCDNLGGKVRSRSYVDQLYVTSLKGDWPLPAPYVLFMNRLGASVGTGVEYAIFARESGTMRVVYWTLAF